MDSSPYFANNALGTCCLICADVTDIIAGLPDGSHTDVALHVQREMVRAREGPLTEPALERPVAGVLAVVASQLVRASELPAAAFPAALVRLLARVRAEVRLQVRRLRVRLAARGVRTRVRGQLLTPTTSASSLRFLLYFARSRGSV